MKRPFGDVDKAAGVEGAPRASGLPIIIKLVCPSDRIGSVIGKGGECVKAIRTATGARIKIEDPIPGHKERAVMVSAPDVVEQPNCPTQEALVRLLARVVEVEGEDGVPVPPDETEAQLIVDRGFVGQIVGKGGVNVTAIRTQTGANINTMPPAQRNPLVAPEEQLIKISGKYESVKQAMAQIVERVRAAIARGQMPAARMHPAAGPPAAVAPVYGAPPAAAGPSIIIDTQYRILMPDHRVGGLIGKGGDHLRRIRTQTGAEVHVEQKLDAVPERMVVCKSQEPLESQWCGAAEALLKCTHHMLHEKPGGPDGKDAADAAAPAGPKQVRLVAQAKQMGAVIGMKGATIKKVSADTQCKLNVIKGDLAPGLGSQYDEVLLVEGMPPNVMQAVRTITMLLRGIMVRQQTEGRPAPPAAAAPPAAYAPPAGAPAPAPWGASPAPYAAPSPYEPRAPPPAYAAPTPAYAAPTPAYGAPPPAYGAPPPAAYAPAPAYGAQQPPPTYAPPAQYAAVPPPAYARAPAAQQAPAAGQPYQPPAGPQFVPSATPYTAEPGATAAAAAGQPPSSGTPYTVVPPASGAPAAAPAYAYTPAPGGATGNLYAMFAPASQQQPPQQAQAQQQQQQQQQQQPGAAQPADSKAALAAQLFGAYQQQPTSAQPAPAASSQAPYAYAQYAQQQQPLPQQQQQGGGGYAHGYSAATGGQ